MWCSVSSRLHPVWVGCTASPLVPIASPQVHAEQLPGKDTRWFPLHRDTKAELAVSTWLGSQGLGTAPGGTVMGLGKQQCDYIPCRDLEGNRIRAVRGAVFQQCRELTVL